jgi:hypothetical protein
MARISTRCGTTSAPSARPNTPRSSDLTGVYRGDDSDRRLRENNSSDRSRHVPERILIPMEENSAETPWKNGCQLFHSLSESVSPTLSAADILTLNAQHFLAPSSDRRHLRHPSSQPAAISGAILDITALKRLTFCASGSTRRNPRHPLSTARICGASLRSVQGRLLNVFDNPPLNPSKAPLTNTTDVRPAPLNALIKANPSQIPKIPHTCHKPHQRKDMTQSAAFWPATFHRPQCDCRGMT